MNITKEQIEKLAAAKAQEEDDGPMQDNSYVLEDVKDMMNRIKLFKEKQIDRHLSELQFSAKLEKQYAKLYENFPTIFGKVMAGTLEFSRLQFMLKMIGEIEKNKVSKHEASVVVGQELVDNIVKPNLAENKK
jgi:hypothetical protein